MRVKVLQSPYAYLLGIGQRYTPILMENLRSPDWRGKSIPHLELKPLPSFWMLPMIPCLDYLSNDT